MPPIEDVLNENAKLKGRVAELEAQIAWFRRQVFAGGKSEKVDSSQLDLLLGKLEEAKAIQAEPVKVSYERKAKTPRKSREELYGNLPVMEESVIEPEAVKADPGAYERLGEEETFEVKIDPPRFYRHRIVRPKYRKVGDKAAAPVAAPAPLRVVEGLASNDLLAYVAVSKFLDHLPLYRQCSIYKRHGFTVSRQNLVRWVEKVAQWLKPIYDQMKIELLESDYVQADETPISYCDPDYGEKKSRKGFLCGLSRPGGDVWYKWSASRSHASVTSHISGFAGVLQADMYQAYVELEKGDDGIELAACWAHARRKFHDAKDRFPRECGIYLGLVGKLYAVEKEIREGSLSPESAKQLRQSKSTNTHARIRRVLEILRHRSLPKSEIGKACDYSLKHWGYLSTYLDHGQVAIDNNAMENAIRPTAVGKKNWLFVGHPEAGERAAILYSILISCQCLDIQPLEYLRDVLGQDTRTLPKQDLRDLTPANWKKSRSA
ncbi:IS66 family transposase [Pelagicoccus sp. SDUM812002]|uniref:IS66 family transposase n=1 Tax=Pelagicoccus sp. SDUM812002 TaxID=3041266 RepID=UPI00281039A5|nr:IS66 family transposase [Pelagicoccus sp. SDUM812002]MDQ8184180.1 IS66 family transposase [Pelagicoccus sp. SDUM812002]